MLWKYYLANGWSIRHGDKGFEAISNKMHLPSQWAKQEAYWAEEQRANESLQEDLPAGLEPAPLGTERSVVSSMPPNEMHRVDMINHLHPFCKRAEHVMEMPDQT